MASPRKKRAPNKSVGARRKMALIAKAVKADRSAAAFKIKAVQLEEAAYDYRKAARDVAEKYGIGI